MGKGSVPVHYMEAAFMKWGILSTGMIARKFAEAVKKSETGTLAAVGSRSFGTANAFAKEFEVPKAYPTYDGVLSDPTVEAVYIAPPHPMHCEWTVAAAKAGKHILCEKPLGMNREEAGTMVGAARRANVVLMEAFMYRCHPQTRRLVELVREGTLGEMRMIRASFCFDRDLGPEHRLFNKALGGGGILDLGCYPVSMSRLLVGAAHGKLFEEPSEVKGSAHFGTTGVDEWASAVLKFPGDIVAEVSCATRVDREPGFLRLYGTEGQLTVPSPWHATQEPGETIIYLQDKEGRREQAVRVRAEKSLYAYEADLFARAVEKGFPEPPAMTPEDSLGNAETLDRWLASAKNE